MEVEILVAEVGPDGAGDQMFHILYDGTVVDERNYAAIGGDAESIRMRLADQWEDAMGIAAAINVGVAVLSGGEREIPAADLEVATLSRSNGRRCFERVTESDLEPLLSDG